MSDSTQLYATNFVLRLIKSLVRPSSGNYALTCPLASSGSFVPRYSATRVHNFQYFSRLWPSDQGKQDEYGKWIICLSLTHTGFTFHSPSKERPRGTGVLLTSITYNNVLLVKITLARNTANLLPINLSFSSLHFTAVEKELCIFCLCIFLCRCLQSSHYCMHAKQKSHPPLPQSNFAPPYLEYKLPRTDWKQNVEADTTATDRL